MKGLFQETWQLIKDFFYFMVNYFFLLWAHSPLLSLTSDSNFTNLEFPRKNQKIRCSLISLYLGEYVFHIITWSFSDKNFRLIKKLSLSSLKTFNTDDESQEFKQKMNAFKEHILGLSGTERNIEKESLAKMIETETQRIDKSEGKINFFLAILLAIITIINIDSIYNSLSHFSLSIKNIVIVLCIYFFLNLCAIILQNMTVRGYNSSSFSDLKTSPEKEEFYIEQLYYDYYFSKEKAQLFVSYICRIYDYIKILIIFMIIFFSINIINKREVDISNQTQKATITTINLNNISNIYSEDSIAFSELLLQIQKNLYSRIVILAPKPISEEIYNKISVFDKQKSYYIIDNELSEDFIKIILEE